MRRLTETRTGRRRSARLLTLTAAAAAAMALIAAGSPHAIAGGPPGSGDNSPEIQQSGGITAVHNQAALSNFQAWMLKQPGIGASGYVGTIYNDANKSMTVMWYGPGSPLLKSIIAEGARRGIPVSVQHRKHSLQQLIAAGHAIWQQAAAGKWTGFKVSGIRELTAVDNGITIYGTYTSVPPAKRAPQVRSLVTEVNGIPARIVPGYPLTLTSSRDNDFAPFNGGGYMITNTNTSTGSNPSTKGTRCTAGFALLVNGTRYTTTARHCLYEHINGVKYTYADYVPRSYFNQAAPAGNHYGDSTGTFSSDGAAGLLTGQGAAQSFVKSWGSTIAWPVTELASVGLHGFVCTEGGNSGEHCGLEVESILDSFNDTDGNFNTIGAVQQNSGIAVIQGDSGGPVIENLGSNTVAAVGMIQGFIDNNPMTGSACGSVYESSAGTTLAKCSTDVEYTAIGTIINSIPGSSLITG